MMHSIKLNLDKPLLKPVDLSKKYWMSGKQCGFCIVCSGSRQFAQV